MGHPGLAVQARARLARLLAWGLFALSRAVGVPNPVEQQRLEWGTRDWPFKHARALRAFSPGAYLHSLARSAFLTQSSNRGLNGAPGTGRPSTRALCAPSRLGLICTLSRGRRS